MKKKTKNGRCPVATTVNEWIDVLHCVENGKTAWAMHAERYKSDPTYNNPPLKQIHLVHQEVLNQYDRAHKTVMRLKPNTPVCHGEKQSHE